MLCVIKQSTFIADCKQSCLTTITNDNLNKTSNSYQLICISATGALVHDSGEVYDDMKLI